MSTRNAKGATLALVAASVIIIILVGVGLFFLMQLFGGFRELQHATDAGNLNVAKQALRTPNFDLSSVQAREFQGLIDADNMKMDLLNYDRCYGQALLVALNAQSDRDSAADPADRKPNKLGLDNAQYVAKMSTEGAGANKGVGKQLYELLSSQSNDNLFNKFDLVANRNSTRMLDSNGKLAHKDTSFAVAFMEEGAPTNVYINPNILPYIGQTTTRATLPAAAVSSKSKGTSPYLAGYKKVTLSVSPSGGGGNVAIDLCGVPVFPTKQPHLVSGRDFEEAKTNNDAKYANLVPPNAFRSVANSSVKKVTANQAGGRAESYAIVGVLDRDFEVSIPRGYIEIYNPAGIGGTAQPPPNDVYNKELMTGIHLAKTASPDGIAFSTDKALLQDWVTFNNKSDSNKTEAEYKELVKRSYDEDGNPKIGYDNKQANFEDIKSNGANGKNTCFWEDVRGENQNATCRGLEGPFNETYPAGDSTAGGDPGAYTVAEKLKERVVHQYNSEAWDAPGDGKCGTVSCPSQSETGLRFWDFTDNASGSHRTGGGARGKNAATAPGASFKISRPGNLNEMLSLFASTDSGANGADIVKQQIIQRMQEIDPTTTVAQAEGVFDDATIELNTTHYIYKDNGAWAFNTTEPPARGLGATTPDGSLQQFTVKYNPVNKWANSKHEQGIHERYFTETSGATKIVDVLNFWTSSGRGNLLAKLEFKNVCGGDLADNNGSTYYCAPD